MVAPNNNLRPRQAAVRRALFRVAPRRNQPLRLDSIIRWSQKTKDGAYRRILCKALLHKRPVDTNRLHLLECGRNTLMPMFSHLSLKKGQTVPKYRQGDCVMVFYPCSNSECQMTFAVKVLKGKNGYKALEKLKERIEYTKLCQQVTLYKQEKAAEEARRDRNNNNNVAYAAEEEEDSDADYDEIERRVQQPDAVVIAQAPPVRRLRFGAAAAANAAAAARNQRVREGILDEEQDLPPRDRLQQRGRRAVQNINNPEQVEQQQEPRRLRPADAANLQEEDRNVKRDTPTGDSIMDALDVDDD